MNQLRDRYLMYLYDIVLKIKIIIIYKIIYLFIIWCFLLVVQDCILILMEVGDGFDNDCDGKVDEEICGDFIGK